MIKLEGLDFVGVGVYLELLARFFESASLVSRLLLLRRDVGLQAARREFSDRDLVSRLFFKSGAEWRSGGRSQDYVL